MHSSQDAQPARIGRFTPLIVLIGLFAAPGLLRAAPPQGPAKQRQIEKLPIGAGCRADDQCTAGAICDEGSCKAAKKSLGMVPPIAFWSSRKPYRSSVTVVPLFHYDRRQARKTTVVPLVLSGWQSDATRNYSRGVALGLYYWNSWRTPEAKNYRRARLLIPLFYSSKRHSSAFTWVLPLNFYTRDQGRSQLYILPLFFHQRDRSAGTKQWASLIPPYYQRRDKKREVDALFPIFWRWHNKAWQSTTYLAPLFYSQSDPDGSTTTLFPLFWRFTDKRHGSSTNILFPLAYWHKRPDGSRFAMILPVYRRFAPNAWGGGIVPIAFFGGDKERHHAVVFPVFWRFGSKKGTTTVVGPVYAHTQPKGWAAGVVPLFFAGRNAGDSHQVVFPIYWHFRSESRRTNTHVAATAFYTRDTKGHAYGLLPLFAAGGDAHSRFLTLPWLLFHRRRARQGDDWLQWAGPYYGYRKGPRRVNVVFPLWYNRHETSPRGNTNVMGLFPLFYYEHTPDQRLFATLLGGWRHVRARRIKQGFVGPVFWHDGPRWRGHGVLPLWYSFTDKRTKSSTTTLMPLYVRHVSPTKTAHVIFPLFWRVTDPEQRTLAIFPLFWQVRRRDGADADILFPVYWRVGHAKGHTSVIGPAYWYGNEKNSGYGFVPLFMYHRSKKSSFAFALPFFYYGHDFAKRRRTWVFGPAYYRSYKRGWASGLVPLVFLKSTPENAHTVVFPIFWRFSEPNKGKSFTLAIPVFHHRTPQRLTWGIAPLFYRSTTIAGAHTTGFFPLFHSARNAERMALYTPLFGRYRSRDYSIWYAATYLHWRSRWRALDVFFPLGFRDHNRQTGRTNFFTLPGYFGRWGDGTSLHIAFPLFWKRKTLDTERTVVFPLYWDFEDRFVTRTTAVVPFFARRRNDRTRSTWYLTLPGVWVRTHPEGTDTVVFPLFWHYAGNRDSTSVGFPLYWDFKRSKNRSTVFFPLYWRFDRPRHRTTVVLNSYFRRNKRDNTYDYHFFPLFHMARPRPGDLTVEVLAGLFGYYRTGPNRMLSILFVPIKLKPAKPKPAPKKAARRRLAPHAL